MAASGPRKQIEPNPALKSELNRILKDATLFHQACVSRDEEAMTDSLVRLMRSIEHTQKGSAQKMRSTEHLPRLLRSAQDQLKAVKSQFGETQRRHIREAFAQFVELAQVYQVASFPIFFCSQDRAVWIQAGAQPQNPVHPDRFGQCGKRVK